MLARKSVLVADDDKVIAELFCKMLVFYGFDAKSCTSGESALTMAGKKCFDAALVDYYLPEANGVQLSLSLRKLCPGIVIIPPGVVHGYRNLSDHPGLVCNFANRLYRGPGRSEPADEIRFEDAADSPFHLD